MLGIVLPLVSTAHVLPVVDVLPVGIVYEVIVVIDVDVVIAPAATVAPASVDGAPEYDTGTKPEQRSAGVVTRRRIIH